MPQAFGRTNDERADAARAALDAYIATNTSQYEDEPIADQIADLLCDLLHLARRDDNFEDLPDGDSREPVELLDRAKSNFEVEESEDWDDATRGMEDQEGSWCRVCQRPVEAGAQPADLCSTHR